MADTPPPFLIRFKYRPTDEELGVPAPELEPELGAPERHDRIDFYQQALGFAARVFTVIELAETERYYLRDQLDRKSAIIPQLVAQGLATADMQVRRALYQRAREALTDCAAILDILSERGTVEPEALEPARALALALLEKLLALTVAPPRVW
jgi:23S rRNA-intervening sequence protein